jgi:hypothetical protein
MIKSQCMTKIKLDYVINQQQQKNIYIGAFQLSKIEFSVLKLIYTVFSYGQQ